MSHNFIFIISRMLDAYSIDISLTTTERNLLWTLNEFLIVAAIWWHIKVHEIQLKTTVSFSNCSIAFHGNIKCLRSILGIFWFESYSCYNRNGFYANFPLMNNFVMQKKLNELEISNLIDFSHTLGVNDTCRNPLLSNNTYTYCGNII